MFKLKLFNNKTTSQVGTMSEKFLSSPKEEEESLSVNSEFIPSNDRLIEHRRRFFVLLLLNLLKVQ